MPPALLQAEPTPSCLPASPAPHPPCRPLSLSPQVKSAEPVLSVVLAQAILGETYPAYVWLSLLPIIAGCSLAAMKEVRRCCCPAAAAAAAAAGAAAA